MSISSNQNIRAIVFVKIELEGLTLRYASENVSATDTDNVDYFWEGRVLSIGNLSSGFNDFKDSSSTISSIPLTLANGKSYSGDSTLDAYLTSYFWGLKKVTIFLKDKLNIIAPVTRRLESWHVGSKQYVGPKKHVGADPTVQSTGTPWSLSTSDIVFKGIVGFPNIYSQTEDAINITVYDQRYKDQYLVAPSVFRSGLIESNSIYSDLGTAVEGKPVPVIYGDFSDAISLPCYQVSGSASNVRKFKIADSDTLASGQAPLVSFTAIALEGAALSSVVQSLSNGYVTVTDSKLLLPGIVSCSVKGKSRGTQIASVFGGSSSSLLEHPVEVIYDLLVNRIAIETTSIDTTTFLSAYNDDTSVRCRRWIGGVETIVEVVNELSFEFGLELFSLYGVFYLRKLSIQSSSENAFTQDDLLSYKVDIDPNRSYSNSFAVRYNKNFQLQDYQSASQLDLLRSIVLHGTTMSSIFESKWNYLNLWVVERFGLLLFLLSRPIRQVSLKLMSTAWDIAPTDVFSLTFHIFSASRMLVRQCSKNLEDFTTDLVAWDIGVTTYFKNWAADAAADPSNYANAQALTYGIWHASSRVIAGFNDTIKVTTSTSATATIPSGDYSSPSALASAIETAINAAVGTNVTVTYNSTTRKFTIATVDVSNFTLHWTDTAEIGRSALGFDVSSNDTGAATYTSDYLSIFEVVSTTEGVSQWS